MNRLKYELRRVNILFATVMSAIFIFLYFCIRCAAKSPVLALRFVSEYVSVPPLWLFGLLEVAAFALLGLSLGIALGARCVFCEISRYRGAFYFAVGAVLALLHSLLFCLLSGFFWEMAVACLACIFIAVAAVNFSRVSFLSALSAVLGGAWFLYLFVLDALIFFRA